jgi:hypothetical protein
MSPRVSVKYLLVPLLCVIAAAVALIHHKIVSGGAWFHWEALEHEEPWITAVLSLGYGYILACIVTYEKH